MTFLGLIYSSAPALERINTAWGYIAADGKAYTYVSDYQGNIRAVVGPDGRTVQTTDYYPYGMPIATSTGLDRNRYKYSGTRSFSEPFERRREDELET